MAASMSRRCVRHLSTFPLLNARPGYPPSLRNVEVILPRVPRITEGNEPQYPPVKPSMTSGSKAAKQARRDLWIDNVRSSDTPVEMIYLLNKRQRWQEVIKPYSLQSGYGHFFRDVTKTAVVDELPENIQTLAESGQVKTEVEVLTERVIELLTVESFSIRRKKQHRIIEHKERSQSLAQNILNLLISHLGNRFPHLTDAVVDGRCQIKSFWERGERRMQFNGEPVCSIRAKKPLGLFAQTTDEVCNGDVVGWPYNPKEIGIFQNHLNSVCFPGFKYQPGHLFPHTQIYGVNFDLDRAERHNIYQEMQDNFGLMAGYAWINALAMYQGYCWFHDIPRPMTAQVIYTDGNRFSFYCYQANTLDLSENSSPWNNVCFQKTSLPMFTDVKDGKVRDFNVEALKLLVAFLINSPERH